MKFKPEGRLYNCLPAGFMTGFSQGNNISPCNRGEKKQYRGFRGLLLLGIHHVCCLIPVQEDVLWEMRFTRTHTHTHKEACGGCIGRACINVLCRAVIMIHYARYNIAQRRAAEARFAVWRRLCCGEGKKKWNKTTERARSSPPNDSCMWDESEPCWGGRRRRRREPDELTSSAWRSCSSPTRRHLRKTGEKDV